MYAKTTVNIRAAPGIKSKIAGHFYWNDKVKVIKKPAENGTKSVIKAKTGIYALSI